jgi:hypothetical protein
MDKHTVTNYEGVLCLFLIHNLNLHPSWDTPVVFYVESNWRFCFKNYSIFIVVSKIFMQKHVSGVKVSILPLIENQKAFSLLEHALQCVRSVMERHRWVIENLIEFLPRSERLLGRNTNKGVLIEIRLRKNTKDVSTYAYFPSQQYFPQISPFRSHSGNASA